MAIKKNSTQPEAPQEGANIVPGGDLPIGQVIPVPSIADLIVQQGDGGPDTAAEDADISDTPEDVPKDPDPMEQLKEKLVDIGIKYADNLGQGQTMNKEQIETLRALHELYTVLNVTPAPF